MGLDMYLEKRIFIGAEYEHRNVTGHISIKIGDKEVPINFNRISYIEESAMYWRKANAIHKWFVDNVQGGVDDCRDAYVTLDTLKELLEVCKEVQEDHSKAEELLPTESGFFFGGTEYDEWYFKDIERTVEELSKVIKEEEEAREHYNVMADFYYHSSW